MSQAVHLVGQTIVSGSGLTDSKCLPLPGVSGRSGTMNPCSSRFYYGLHSQPNVGPLRCASYPCRASSNNGYNRRNPDFPRQNKQHGFSRGRNNNNHSGNNNRHQNEERDRDRDRDRDRESFENFEEPEILSSKNGPYMSMSSSPKFQATAGPGPREKEIVELFRKVQAQLRERAAASRDEGKRSESSAGPGRESETVDSLLKLLRKHSTEQAKRGGGSGREYSPPDPQGQNGQYVRVKVSGGSSNSNKEPGKDSISSSSSRPVSSFQRKSPVPRMKFQPLFSDEDASNSAPRTDSVWKGKEKHAEDFPKPDLGLEFGEDLEDDEPELVQLLNGGLSRAEEAIVDDESEEEEDEEEEEKFAEHEDLSGWKLPELRVLAKSRGVKGYSKMKKGELLDLLSGSSV